MIRTAARLSAWLCVSLCLSLADSAGAAEAPGYHVIEKIAIGGDGGWDYLTLDPVTRQLFIARSNRVMVVDVDKEKLIGELPDTPGVHGVALVAKFNHGFTSNGGDSTVTVFDLKTLKAVKKITVGKRPDAILYEPESSQVFTFNASGTASVIDPEKQEVVATIELGGKPEFAVADDKGNVFVNLEDKSEVLAIDAHKHTVAHRWPTKPGEEPAGLAIDRARGRLFSTCHNQRMVVIDTADGKVLGSAAIGKGTDACAYDADSDLAFSSNGDGTLTVARADKLGALTVLETVDTQPGARTMALDLKTHNILLVTAKPIPGERRKYEPDTFVILVVGK